MTKERFAEIMEKLGVKAAEITPMLCYSNSSKVYSIMGGAKNIPPHVAKMMELHLEVFELKQALAAKGGK